MSDASEGDWREAFAYGGKWSQHLGRIAEELHNLVDFRFGYGESYRDPPYKVTHCDNCPVEIFHQRYICFDNGICQRTGQNRGMMRGSCICGSMTGSPLICMGELGRRPEESGCTASHAKVEEVSGPKRSFIVSLSILVSGIRFSVVLLSTARAQYALRSYWSHVETKSFPSPTSC
jgi:hypothetical protein